MNFSKCVAACAVVFAGLLSSTAGLADSGGVIPVELVNRDGRYMLLRGGEPYVIKGAGLKSSDVAVFAGHGGNSFRTWSTDEGGRTGLSILDEALANGVTVMLCIDIGRERHGFDYDDEQAVAEQFEFARGEVLKYKDHPALLAWIIGNEPNLSATNPKVYDAINDISEMIHELDGNHPTTTALAGFGGDLPDLIATRSPDLDFISVQYYGDLITLPDHLKKIGFDKPYMVTEWGSIGHWEVPKTPWGAPVEQHSSAKADNYMKGYQVAIASDPDRAIGSYVFFWGQKQERTPTWYGMFLDDGSETEVIDVMHYIWNGQWPDNRSPRVEQVTLDSKTAYDGVTLSSGASYPASIAVNDPDGDALRYRWEVLRESEATQEGGDPEEVPGAVPGLIDHPDRATVSVMAPQSPGAYRLFVTVYDGQGHAGHANIPFLVQ